MLLDQSYQCKQKEVRFQEKLSNNEILNIKFYISLLTHDIFFLKVNIC